MGKKLIVYLIDGADDGPRTVEIGNWSGKAISTPRSMMIKMLKRDEYKKPGVYVLKSDSENERYNDKIYIGESEVLRERFSHHIKDEGKDFEECVAFISKDEMLTKAHIKYIESRLITLAKEANIAQLENINQPTLNALSEADISDMEEYIKQIKLILPAIGYDFLSTNKVENIDKKTCTSNEIIKFSIKSKKYNATMIEIDEGVIVFKGSQARKNAVKSMSKDREKLRNRLIDSKILLDSGDCYVFTEDTKFSSTSKAASVILGRQAPGPLCWVDSKNKSVKEYEIERLAESK